MNVNEYYYKTWKYIPTCPSVLHTLPDSFAIEPVSAQATKEVFNNSVIPKITFPAHAAFGFISADWMTL